MTALSLFNPDISAPLSVPDIVAARLAYLAARVAKGDFAAKNFKLHKHYLTRFAEAFPIPVSACRQEDLEAWIDRNPQWKSGHTKKTVVNVVRDCFMWAAKPKKGNLIDHCPFDRIEAITAIPYKARRSASYQEYLTLLRNGGLPLKEGLFTIFKTGCRPCEMCELLRPWVILDAANPHLCLEKHKTIRKTGKPKLIGLDDVMVRFFKRLLAREYAGTLPDRVYTNVEDDRCNCGNTVTPHSPSDHVFFNCDGNPWIEQVFAQNLRRVADRAGLDEGVVKKVSAGCFRSTYACDLIEAGFTNREVADALGHTTTDMVDHVYGAETRQRAAHLDSIAKRAATRRKK